MKTSTFFLLLLLLTVTARGQERYQLSGSVKACYNSGFESYASDSGIRVVLRSLSSGEELHSAVDSVGTFSFDSLAAGSYKLSAFILVLPENDTTLEINRHTNGVTFCIDKIYKAAPSDSIEKYRQQAVDDIENGNAKIYEWTVWSITEDPYQRLNPKVKKKYGFEYEMMSCVRQMTREEIVQMKLWQAYNEVVYQHLADLYGERWRRGLKHERRKLRKE